MFSSFFGKRRSSPVEDETPPIPGATADDFVVVNPSPTPPRGLYPNVSGGGSFPQRPAPPAPSARPLVDPTFHYLQGVPFRMCKELQLASNKEAFASEFNNIIAMTKLNMSGYDYDFSTEKSVLNEC